MDNQARIIAQAIKEGLNPSRLTPAQYRRLAIKVRTLGELAHDAAKAIDSRLHTELGLRVVPEHVVESNKAKCIACPDGKYQILEMKRKRKVDGVVRLTVVRSEPVCNACHCQGKFLESKQKDAEGYCPLGHWDNRTAGAQA